MEKRWISAHYPNPFRVATSSACVRIVAISITLVSILGLVTPLVGHTDDYPSKPIRLIVPFPAGGGADTFSRFFVPYLTSRLGQPIIIENRAGASGTIGTAMVKQVPANGYTLFYALEDTHALGPALMKNPGYDPVTDFAPISLLSNYQLVLAVNVDFPVKSVDDLVRLARTKPGALSYASWGYGSTAHIVTERFAREAVLDVLHVPYKGSAPVVVDLIGGQVHFALLPPALGIAYAKAGKVRALAVTGHHRMPALPEVPTLTEAGYPTATFVGWSGIAAPAGTPRAIIDRLNAAIRDAITEPAVVARWIDVGSEAIAGTPEEFAAVIQKDVAKYSQIVRDGGLAMQ